MTVATVPPDDIHATLKRDLEMVRAGILYADSISLISPGAVWIDSLDDLQAAGSDALVRMIPRLSDQAIAHMAPPGSPPIPPNFQEMVAQIFAGGMEGYRENLKLLGTLSAEQVERAETVEAMFSMANEQFHEIGAELLDKNRVDELRAAIRADLVTVEAPFQTSRPSKFVAEDLAPLFNYATDDDSFPPEFLVEWITTLADLVSTPGRTVLLDEGSSEIARALQADGVVKVPRSTRRGSAEALAGTRFVARLPAFPEAPLDELIDLRRDLDASLGRYRTGVSRVAAGLSKEAFSEDWLDEADEIWGREVVPAIEEIHSELADSSFVRSLGKGLATDSRTVLATGTVVVSGLAAHGVTHNALVTAISAALPLAANLLGTEVRRRGQKRAAERKEFYYALELGRRLRDRRR